MTSDRGVAYVELETREAQREEEFYRLDGEWETVAHDPRLLWPDTLSVTTDGYLYVPANQLHRQARYHQGRDLRYKPYTVFRIRIDAQPVLLR